MPDTIRIDELSPTASASRQHIVAAMKDGATVGVLVDQIISLAVQDATASIVSNTSNLLVADRNTAIALDVSPDIQEITLLAFDSAVHPFKGRAKYRRQASEPVAYPTLSKFQSNDGTWWLLNEKVIYVAMFGAVGDMTYTIQTEGYVRTTGTDDMNAFRAADDFVTVSNKGVYFYEDDHYLVGEFRPRADCRDVTNHRAKLWVHFGLLEIGVHPEGSGGAFTGDIIGQYDHDEPSKPSNSGHLGNVFVLGDYLTPDVQERVGNMHVDVRMCRAANVVGQNSRASTLCNLIGYVEDCTIRIGVHGKTNVSSGFVIQEHWGGQYDAATLVEGETDLAKADILETYYPVGNEIIFTTQFDKADHILTRVYVGSAEGLQRWGTFRSIGVKSPVLMLVGDNTDIFALTKQQGTIKKGVYLGFGHAKGCDFDPITEVGSSVISFTCRGTSKFEEVTTVDGPKDKIRQLLSHIICEGFHIEATGTNITGVRLFGMHGKFNLGDLWVYGCEKGAVETEGSIADVQYNLIDSDSTIRHEFSKGGRIEVNTSKGDLQNGAEDGPSKQGWGSNNAAAYIFGSTLTTTLDAVANEGDTSITIGAIAQDLPIGTVLKIGNQKVTVREFAQDGETVIQVSPVQEMVPITSTVIVDRRSRIDSFIGAYESSEFGLFISGSDVYNADLSRVRWTGRYAARLEDYSTLNLVGELPSIVGRVTSASVYTVSVDPGSHVTCTGMRIPSNPRVTSHFQLQRTGGAGPWGTATFTGCVIEDVNTLVTASADIDDQVKLYGCFDFDGNPLPETLGAI